MCALTQPSRSHGTPIQSWLPGTYMTLGELLCVCFPSSLLPKPRTCLYFFAIGRSKQKQTKIWDLAYKLCPLGRSWVTQSLAVFGDLTSVPGCVNPECYVGNLGLYYTPVTHRSSPYVCSAHPAGPLSYTHQTSLMSLLTSIVLSVLYSLFSLIFPLIL